MTRLSRTRLARARGPWAVAGLALLVVTLLAALAWAAPEAGAVAVAVDAGAGASAAVVPAATAVTSAEPQAPAPAESFPVHLHDHEVFVLRVGRLGVPAEERARRAQQALEHAFESDPDADVTVERTRPDVAVVMLGKAPVVQLGPEDARAAGDASLQVHGAAVAQAVRDAVHAERTRRDVAHTVFAWSLVVFTGLLAFLAIRRLSDISRKLRVWIQKNAKRLPGLRAGAIEVLRPAAFQGAIRLGVSALERAMQLALLYVWLVFVLSLFESTRDVGKRVTGLVLVPFGALAGRLAVSLPLIVVGVIATLALALLLRFVRLFFQSVESGETQFVWLPQDFAGPTSAVVRLGIVVAALVVGAPLVTGSEQGTAGRAAFVMMGALGLATVPLLASAAVGFVSVFWRRLRVGDFVSYDGRQGRVATLTLLDIRIHDGEGTELRVPHLATLVRPVRVLGPYPLAVVDVVVDPKASQPEVREVLLAAGATRHGAPRVRLLGIDADGARYEVVAKRDLDDPDPAVAVAQALADAGIALGRARGA